MYVRQGKGTKFLVSLSSVGVNEGSNVPRKYCNPFFGRISKNRNDFAFSCIWGLLTRVLVLKVAKRDCWRPYCQLAVYLATAVRAARVPASERQSDSCRRLGRVMRYFALLLSFVLVLLAKGDYFSGKWPSLLLTRLSVQRSNAGIDGEGRYRSLAAATPWENGKNVNNTTATRHRSPPNSQRWTTNYPFSLQSHTKPSILFRILCFLHFEASFLDASKHSNTHIRRVREKGRSFLSTDLKFE